MLGSYTWSKLLTDADSSEPWIAVVIGSAVGAGATQNHYNRGPEKALGVLDLPQMLGQGKKFLNHGLTSRLLGDWNISTFTFAQSGYPMGVVDTRYQNNLRAGTPRPNITGHEWRAQKTGANFDPDKDSFYNRTVFVGRTNAAADPFGDTPRLVGGTEDLEPSGFPGSRQR